MTKTKLYGLGRRGVAIHHPDFEVVGGEGAVAAPVPLFTDRTVVERVIAERNTEHGIGSLHVITYEVQS